MGELTPEAIGALGNAIGSIGGSIAQGQNNRAMIDISNQMYDKQRKDALADWNMQNTYNSPKQQMLRFKEAGLNPNLIYGQMTNAPIVRSTNQDVPRLAPVNYAEGLGTGLSSYYDIQLKNAQTNNLKKQNDLLATESLIKTADLLGKSYANEKMKNELAQQPQLLSTTLEGLKANNDKILNDIRVSQQMQPGALKLQTATIQGALQNVANMKILNAKTETERKQIIQNIENLKKEGILKQLDINLKQKGINPSDPAYLRALGQIVSTKNVEDMKNSIKKFFIKGWRP